MTGAALGLRSRVATWAAAVLCLAIACGILLRFQNLGGKVFWQDESYTALHASGHLDRGDLRPLFDGRIHSAGELRRLEQITPDRGWGATVSAIASEDSDQGLLYYVFERGFMQIFGSSITAYRLLGALIGVLTIAAAWLFASALFESVTIAAIFAAIVALSPFEVLYAHEARSYTLTALMTLVTSAALLHAVRRKSPGTWLAYALSVALGLYASMLLAAVVLAHALYVIFEYRYRGERGAVAWTIGSAALGVVLFLPWIAVVIAHQRMVSTELVWGSTAYPLRSMLEKWLFNASAQFFDLEWISLKFAAIGALVLLLAVVSVVVLVRTAPERRWSFVVLLGGVTAVLLIGRDLVQHSHWSTTARYLIPTWLAMQLAVAYALDRWMAPSGEVRRGVRLAAPAIFVALLLLEGVSSWIGTRASAWYNNELSAATPSLANAIDETENPLVVGEKSWAFYLDASNYLRPDVQVLLFADARGAHIDTAGYRNVLVPTPSAALRAALQQSGYALRLVYRFGGTAQPYAQFHQTLKSGARPSSSSVSFPNELYVAVPTARAR
jgi:uncharacterized membrane protein